MKLNKKQIIITGGTSGIGYEMVKRLHVDNDVIVIAKTLEKLNSLKKEYENIITIQADLTDLESLDTLVAEITKNVKKIDLLINNAAIQYPHNFTDNDFKYSSIQHEITLNFTSICCLTALLLPALNHQKKSVILMMNSGLALSPKTSSAIYCATKGALNIFSQSLRHQLENTNINIHQAFLPLVNTPMTKGRGQNKISAKKASELILQGIENNILDHDIGKVKLLRWLLRLAPSIAKNKMKKI